jgi:transposase
MVRRVITDNIWEQLENTLRLKGCHRWKNDRNIMEAILWKLRTGAPWRDLPPDYGSWSNTHRRFTRWRDKGIWESLLEKLINNPDFEWLMIDASHVKVHQHAAGARGGNQDMGRTKGGSIQSYIWPWMRLVIRSECLLHQVPQLIARRLTN